MLSLAAAAIAFAGIVTAGECILRRVNKVGGISFLRLGRVQMSFCVVALIPKKRLAQRINLALGE